MHMTEMSLGRGERINRIRGVSIYFDTLTLFTAFRPARDDVVHVWSAISRLDELKSGLNSAVCLTAEPVEVSATLCHWDVYAWFTCRMVGVKRAV